MGGGSDCDCGGLYLLAGLLGETRVYIPRGRKRCGLHHTFCGVSHIYMLVIYMRKYLNLTRSSGVSNVLAIDF